PVMIKGKRIKTIDVHAHVLFEDATKLMGEDAARVAPNLVKGEPQTFINPVSERLKAMDDMADDMKGTSINAVWYLKNRDVAGQIVKVNNEKLAELCGAHPDRFAAFASLALQHPDLAVEQLDYAVRKLGLKGSAIGGSVLGESFHEARFNPVWAKAEELGAVLFIHPQSTP